jgi:hypothetical protein
VNNEGRYQELLVGPIEPLDQRNDMFRKSQHDHHDLVGAAIRNVPALNPLFLRLDGILGYGKQSAPATIWED